MLGIGITFLLAATRRCGVALVAPSTTPTSLNSLRQRHALLPFSVYNAEEMSRNVVSVTYTVRC